MDIRGRYNYGVELYYDGSNAYLKYDGRRLYIKSNLENVDNIVQIQGSGTGNGILRIEDQDGAEYLKFECAAGGGYINSAGTSPTGIFIQAGAEANVYFFSDSTEGETRELKIYGHRTGDSKRSLEIGVGVDAANTASFDGLSNYKFDGTINAVTAFQVNGTQVIGARVVDARCDDTINSGDATTDGVIDSLRDAMISHGLLAAS